MMQDLRFIALVIFAFAGWAFWLLEMRHSWFLPGFANWLVRRLFTLALVMTAIARGASAYLAEYRIVRSRPVEPMNEYQEINTRPC
jgi:hypothetical protein